MSERPRVNAKGQQELDKAQETLDNFKEQIIAATSDVAEVGKIEEYEPQTKLSRREAEGMGPIILKPKRTIGSKEKFNEKFRAEYEDSKKYVKFIAENIEVKGESIDLWVKPYPGLPAENWDIPVNKPVAAPRYVAERISNCKYHVLEMEDRPIAQEGGAVFTGQLIAKHTRHRLDARPVGSPFSTL